MQAGEVDLAVHSLKDVPTALPEGPALAAVLERADPATRSSPGGRASRRASRGGARGDHEPAAARPAAGPPARLGWSTSAGTSTRGSASCTRASSTRSCSRSPDSHGWVGRTRPPNGWTRSVSSPRRAGRDRPRGTGKRCQDAEGRASSSTTGPPAGGDGGAGLPRETGRGCNVRCAPSPAAWGVLRLVAFVAGPDGSGLLRGEGEGEDEEGLGRGVAEALRAQGATLVAR